MAFDPHIAQGSELTNAELCGIFGCSLMGGMNRSHKTNTLVLVSNRVKSIYQDRIDGDVIHYTGMGQVGDQDLNATQNRTLNESLTNGVGIHLFEVLQAGKYIYCGEVQLAGNPYQETQLDVGGNDRVVWMFPLKLKNSSKFQPVAAEKINSMYVKRESVIHQLGRSELQRRAKQAVKMPGSREVTAKQYQRNEYVAEEARRRANGVCQLCETPAPFKNKKGIPHLEVHHIVWLARGGEDSLENTVALCPNCHRKMHVLDLEVDKNKLTLVVSV
jgi:5-methylcytosine-specific restriction enzyme A